MDHDHETSGIGGNAKIRIAFYVLLAIAMFFLLTEHRAHAFGILPYLLLLACPLMHLFGHHGHSHGTSSKEPAQGSGTAEHRHS